MATSVDTKLLRSTKFPPELSQKVDMHKVNVEVMKKWMAGKISEILKNDDDVVIELCFNLIEGERFPDIKRMQIQLTGFLDKDTAPFCKELWKLCLSAQSNSQGVPKELLEAKKLELIQGKIEAEKAADEARRRRTKETVQKDGDLKQIKDGERGEWGRGDRTDTWRRGRSDHEHNRGGRRGADRRRFSRPRSPRRRNSLDRLSYRAPPRGGDSYVPNSGARGRHNERRSRASPSPSRSSMSRSRSDSRSPPRPKYRSLSRSRTPPRRRNRSRSPSGPRDRRRGGRGNRRSPARRPRRRSTTPSDVSRSPPPRRRAVTSSLSPSPPPRSSRARRGRSSAARSRSHSSMRSRSRTSHRAHPPSNDRPRSASPSRVISREPRDSYSRRTRDERRLSRSHSRSKSPPRSRHNSIRSLSPRLRERKRHRSLERYGPAKRRRDTSSVSSSQNIKDQIADSEIELSRRSSRPDVNLDHADHDEAIVPEQQASELREKVLREKIKKMRTA